MHDYVHFLCSIVYCVKIILVDENLCETCFHFILKWFLLIINSFEEMYVLPEGDLQKVAQTSIFEIFESALIPVKSESMPLIIIFNTHY